MREITKQTVSILCLYLLISHCRSCDWGEKAELSNETLPLEIKKSKIRVIRFPRLLLLPMLSTLLLFLKQNLGWSSFTACGQWDRPLRWLTEPSMPFVGLVCGMRSLWFPDWGAERPCPFIYIPLLLGLCRDISPLTCFTLFTPSGCGLRAAVSHRRGRCPGKVRNQMLKDGKEGRKSRNLKVMQSRLQIPSAQNGPKTAAALLLFGCVHVCCWQQGWWKQREVNRNVKQNTRLLTPHAAPRRHRWGGGRWDVRRWELALTSSTSTELSILSRFSGFLQTCMYISLRRCYSRVLRRMWCITVGVCQLLWRSEIWDWEFFSIAFQRPLTRRRRSRQ